jgi:hypothetical protein
MPTLHIQHQITDFETWRAAFDRFADARRHAGVQEQRVRQPVDDAGYVVIELDFDSIGQAAAFQRFLETKVWGTHENAPALVGSPQTMILEPAPTE